MSKTLQQFIDEHNGKYLEVAGSDNAINQCVDLANGYIRDVLNLPIIEWTNAKDFPEAASSKYDFIQNTPNAIIEYGDIPVWNGNAGGGAGHIGVCVEGDIDDFVSFDQNWPGNSPCVLVNHSYTNVRGWLRVKSSGGKYTEEEMTEVREARDKNWDSYQAEIKSHAETKTKVDQYKSEAESRKKELENFITELAQKLFLPTTSDKSDIVSSVERLLAVEDQLTKAQVELQKKEETFATERSQFLTRIEELELANEGIQKQLNLLKDDISQQKETEAHFSWLKKLLNIFS